MNVRKSQTAHTVGAPTFGGTMRALLSAFPNPFHYMHAYRHMRRFKAMDDALLHDIGLTRSDIDRVRFGDFLKQPQR